jgi:hypothetical protein
MSEKADVIMNKIAGKEKNASVAPVADQLIEHYRSGGPKPKFNEYLIEGRQLAEKSIKRRHRGGTIGLGVLGAMAGSVAAGAEGSIRHGLGGAAVGGALGAGAGYLSGLSAKKRRMEYVKSPAFEVKELSGYKARDAQLKYLYKNKEK